MNQQAITRVGRFAVDAARRNAHGRVFVMVLRFIGRIHDDVAALVTVHMVFVVLVPDSTVLRRADSPGF